MTMDDSAIFIREYLEKEYSDILARVYKENDCISVDENQYNINLLECPGRCIMSTTFFGTGEERNLIIIINRFIEAIIKYYKWEGVNADEIIKWN